MNRFAAKRVQAMAVSTMSEAALGSLGIWTIGGYINKMKLLFLQRLIVSYPSSVEKVLFIRRLCSFIYGSSVPSLGFIPDIITVLKRYNLYNYLDLYLTDGVFPGKIEWKRIVSASILENEQLTWRESMSERINLDLYSRVHTKLRPLDLWTTAWCNPCYLKPIAGLVNILCGNIPLELLNATVKSDAGIYCLLCGKDGIIFCG